MLVDVQFGSKTYEVEVPKVEGQITEGAALQAIERWATSRRIVNTKVVPAFPDGLSFKGCISNGRRPAFCVTGVQLPAEESAVAVCG